MPTVLLLKDVSPERSELRSRLNAGCAEIIPGLLESIRKATSERREYGNGKRSVFATGVKVGKSIKPRKEMRYD